MPDAPSPTPVVLDTSFLLNVLIGGDDDEIVDIWNEWVELDIPAVSPHLVTYELSNALWQLTRRDLLQLSTVRAAMDRLFDLRIDLVSPEPDHERVYDLVQTHRLGKTYDLYFVALAERLGSTLWTCDQSLYNAVSRSYPAIRVVRGAW